MDIKLYDQIIKVMDTQKFILEKFIEEVNHRKELEKTINEQFDELNNKLDKIYDAL